VQSISALKRPGLDESTKMRSAIWTASSMYVGDDQDGFGREVLASPEVHNSSERRFTAVSTSRALNGSSISKRVRFDHQRTGETNPLAHTP